MSSMSSSVVATSRNAPDLLRRELDATRLGEPEGEIAGVVLGDLVVGEVFDRPEVGPALSGLLIVFFTVVV